MLAPCTRCQRHVRSDDAHCPFCGGEPRRAAAVAVLGRISRIAVFAGAALAANACGQGIAPERPAQPAPTGTVKGVATWSGANMFGSHSGALRSATVKLRSADHEIQRTARTNELGEFEFDDVPVGSYEVSLVGHRDEQSRSEPVQVDVHASSTESANLTSHVAMPYGAPPSRRRLV